MKTQPDFRTLGCIECLEGAGLGFDFSMAFQPIVNTTADVIFAHEALVRGLNNESAAKVLGQVNIGNQYRFDQACRVKAIKLAADLAIPTFLSINFLPNAVYRPELCIRTTLAAAEEYSFPIENIIFEITESEKIEDHVHLKEIIDYYKSSGFKTAIDDFGAGYAGLNLLAEIQTDFIKLDMALTRNIGEDKVRQAIVNGIVQACNDLSITIIAEGVEDYAELTTLQSFGIELFQGYYFARPAFEMLPEVPESKFSEPVSNS
jgi:EAL domain-containing protein (putative c-di-GMP-specific phosphodiesterase class I)